MLKSPSVGHLKLQDDGSFQVVAPLKELEGLKHSLRHSRLFFQLETGTHTGEMHMRLEISYGRVLIQSHRIRAGVGYGVLKTTCLYNLDSSLDAILLQNLRPHRFSMSASSHSLTFIGGDAQLCEGVRLEEGVLRSSLEDVRKMLRRVAWGTETRWKKERYRYIKPESGKCQADLIRLARVGYRCLKPLWQNIEGSEDLSYPDRLARKQKFRAMMRKPGFVQVAALKSIKHVAPVALFYDHPLDDGLELEKYTFCPAYLKEIEQGLPPGETTCFQDKCAYEDERTVVCPSGFWGFRHHIGFPPGRSKHCATKIPLDQQLELAIAVSTDKQFVERKEHMQTLRELTSSWTVAESRKSTLDLMEKQPLHLLYFYCHGGYQSGIPFLSVGDPSGEVILPGSLPEKVWHPTRPLVILNGCHTTQVTPDLTNEFVSSFTEHNAAGVIGTEITLFEPLARQFMEHFLPLFLKGVTVGEAVRQVRLDLLKDHNPLGLIYVPYALPSLRLDVKEASVE